MKEIVLIGGTFNPITRAHLQMGLTAKNFFPNADIHYVLSNMDYISKWKNTTHGDAFSSDKREELVRKVVEDYGFFLQMKEATGELSGTTYDTVMYYKSLGYDKIYFCIGFDKLSQIGKWKNAENLCKEVELLLFTRDGKGKLDYKGDLSNWNIVEIPMCGIYEGVSSTIVRDAFYRNELKSVERFLDTHTYNVLKERCIKYHNRKEKDKMGREFDAKEVAEDIVKWTREWFDAYAPNAKAVIGISGGKDSTVTAGILAKAIGPERIVGVMLPNGVQKDISDSIRVFEHLGIKQHCINIKNAVEGLYNEVKEEFPLNDVATINTPPRIRLTTLYAVAASVGGIVMNNSNASEIYTGYFTKNADNRGDLALLGNLTASEVVALGHALGLPADLVDKTPTDGLCGKTDEDNLGFTYKDLDNYLRGGSVASDVKERIDTAHRKSMHKLNAMPTFPYHK